MPAQPLCAVPHFSEVLIMLTTRSVVRTCPTWAGDHAYIILLFAPQHLLGRQPAWGNSHFSTACSHGTSLTFKLTWKPFSEWSPLSHLLALVPCFGQVVQRNQCCLLLSMNSGKWTILQPTLLKKMGNHLLIQECMRILCWNTIGRTYTTYLTQVFSKSWILSAYLNLFGPFLILACCLFIWHVFLLCYECNFAWDVTISRGI